MIFRLVRYAFRAIGVSLIIFVMLEGCIRLGGSLFHRNHSISSEFDAEFANIKKMTWQPYLYWRAPRFSGKFIHVEEDGTRYTTNHFHKKVDSVRIFLFGGSALWGYGVHNEQTIPSQLSKILYQSGYKNFLVSNFGQYGYVLNQEMLLLLMELKRGNVPAIAVFYDGVNETLAAFRNREAGVTLIENALRTQISLRSRWEDAMREVGILEILSWKSAFIRALIRLKERSFMTRTVFNNKWPMKLALGPTQFSRTSEERPALVSHVIRNYFEGLKLIETISVSYGIEAYYFWQPTLFSKKQLSSTEIVIKKNQRAEESFFGDVYSEIAAQKRLPKGFYDFQNILDEHPGTTFSDFCHSNAEGNRIVAEKLAEILSLDLQRS